MSEHYHAIVDKEFLGRVMKSIDTAVEPLDHPSDGSFVALARKFFRADDRMR